MANPFPANFETPEGDRRLTGQVDFTDPANQPGATFNGGTITNELTISPVAQTNGPLRINSPDHEATGSDVIKVTNADTDTLLELFSSGHLRLKCEFNESKAFEFIQDVAQSNTGWLVYAHDTPNNATGGVGQGGFLKMAGVNAAPADASLSAGQVALWFDATNGASKLMIKAKSLNGTVVTGSVALA